MPALSTDLVILCEQQREHVFSIGLARRRDAVSPEFLLDSGVWPPTSAFSVRAAKNVIAAWQRKTGIAEVVFVPARLRGELAEGTT